MRNLGNLAHLVTGGLVLALAWLAAAVALYPFRDTRRLARPCFGLALFHLWPGGKELVRESELEAYREYVRTGRCPEPTRRLRSDWALPGELVLWAPIGVVLGAAHIVHGCILALLRLSLPWTQPSFSLLPACAFPCGWRAVEPCEARSRLFLMPGQTPRQMIAPGRPLGTSPARVAPRALGLAMVLGACVFADGPLLVAPPALGIPAAPGRHAVALATGAAGHFTRPLALPPLPVGRHGRATEKPATCGAAAIRSQVARLSRRHPEFPLPLGSRAVTTRAGYLQVPPLHRIRKIDRLAATVKNARLTKQPCSKAVAGHAIRFAAYAADRAVFFRQASKAAPDGFGKVPEFPQLVKRYAVQPAHVLNLQHLLVSTSPAKAPNTASAEDMAARIARAGLI